MSGTPRPCASELIGLTVYWPHPNPKLSYHVGILLAALMSAQPSGGQNCSAVGLRPGVRTSVSEYQTLQAASPAQTNLFSPQKDIHGPPSSSLRQVYLETQAGLLEGAGWTTFRSLSWVSGTRLGSSLHLPPSCTVDLTSRAVTRATSQSSLNRVF